MVWDTSPERMAILRQSIRPIHTDMPLRQVLSEDFPRDCAGLPISGGWGYTQQEAIVFVRSQFPRPQAPDFGSLEYHIAQKIIYEELIIFRAKDDRFSGIDIIRKKQRMLADGGKRYDCFNFNITCWSDFHWETLKKEWEDSGRSSSFDAAEHANKRNAAKIDFERCLWFDITSVFSN